MILNLEPVRNLERCVNSPCPETCAACPHVSEDGPCRQRLVQSLDVVLSSAGTKKADQFLAALREHGACTDQFLRDLYYYLKRKGFVFAMRFRDSSQLPDRSGKVYE